MPRRSPESLADYLVVAIAPALIVLMVGSLMWFLVEVFYQGEYKGRLLWIMAMFVIAIVGIARISIEEGLAYASVFGWALAAAVGLALVRLVSDGLFLSAFMMILVWWAAHKLTWDCTVIDEDQDVSGQGLLQQMGLDPTAEKLAGSIPGTTSTGPSPEATTSTNTAPAPPWWETLLEPDRRPHAPGVWVVYFSLAALPLFGIGGWFVPADAARRSLVFGLLVIYVASGLGLLLATSFLGLRRYLRQRKLEMPLEMTSTWILVGIGLIFATLIVATVLPRPSREYSLSQLPFAVTSAARRASQVAFGKEGTKDDAAKNPSSTTAKDNQKTNRKSDDQKGKGEVGQKQDSSAEKTQSGGNDKGDKGGKSQSGQSKAAQSKESKDKNRDAESQSKQESQNKQQDQQDQQQKTDDPRNESRDREGRTQGDQQQNENSNQQQPPPPNENQVQSQPPSNPPNPTSTISRVTSFLGSSLAFLLRILFYAGLILGGLLAAWFYREELIAAWQKLLIELNELWDRWFGKKKKEEEAAAAAVAAPPPPRPFDSYRDPFASGDAQGMSWPQLVRYTFEALEAWGRERSCPRATGQTPHEFALALASSQPGVATGVQTLAAWYGQLAYAPKAAPPGNLEPLRQLWTALRAN